MSVLSVRIDWSDKNGKVIETQLNDALDWSLQSSIDLKDNFVDLNFRNGWRTTSYRDYVDNLGVIRFQEAHQLKVYAKYLESAADSIDTSTGSSDLLMTVMVVEFETNHGENRTSIRVKGSDKSYVLLNKIWSEVYLTTDGKNAPEIILDTLRNTTQSDRGDGQYAVSAALVSAGGFIQDTREDASVFPDVQYQNLWKATYEWFSELSQIEFTNTAAELSGDTLVHGRPFVFYIDDRNRFHWYYPTDGVETQLNGSLTAAATTVTVDDTTDFDSSGRFQIGGERIDYTGKGATTFTGCTRGVDGTVAAAHSDNALVSDRVVFEVGVDAIYEVKMTKKVFDVTNLIIFNAGQDMSGVQIIGYYYDPTSNSNTLKMSFRPFTDIAKEWIGRDYAVNTSRDAGSYPQYPASYTVTPAWSSSTVANDADYNDSLWDFCLEKGRARAKNIMQKVGHARWKGSIEVKGHRYSVGQLTELTDASLGLYREKVRIMSMRHLFRKDGWFTELELEQDAKVITKLGVA